ncbi:MAG: glutamate mutase L [Oscillospiraceae bacterium]
MCTPSRKALPPRSITVCKGLPEPFVKRTVEGDIGMRYSVRGILDAAGPGSSAASPAFPSPEFKHWSSSCGNTQILFPMEIRELEALDRALASLRH